jgi:hypothetical protein
MPGSITVIGKMGIDMGIAFGWVRQPPQLYRCVYTHFRQLGVLKQVLTRALWKVLPRDPVHN